MEFINNGEPIKVRIGNLDKCHWITLRTGRRVDLPGEVGKSYGLTIYEYKKKEVPIDPEIKQTEKIEKKVKINFEEELIKINGIGKKNAEKIISQYTREKLIKAIKNEEDLPFSDKVDDLLRKYYG